MKNKPQLLKNILLVFVSSILGILLFELLAFAYIEFCGGPLTVKVLGTDNTVRKLHSISDIEKAANGEIIVEGVPKERLKKILQYLNEWGIHKYDVLDNEEFTPEENKYRFGNKDYSDLPAKKLIAYPFTKNFDKIIELKSIPEGKILYSVRYKINEFGRKKTGYENRDGANENFLFVGCSFTFGDGIESEFAFPSRFGYYSSENAYNLGVGGGSQLHHLKFLANSKYNDFYKLRNNLPSTVVYTFIDDHMRRINGTTVYLPNNYMFLNDRYYYIENDKLKFDTTFNDRIFTKARFYKNLGKSSLIKLIGIELPIFGDYHFNLYVQTLVKMKEELKKKIPNMNKFIFVFYPDATLFHKQLLNHLKKYDDIEILDYSFLRLESLMKNRNLLRLDPHPSKETHDLIGYLLSRELIDHEEKAK